jgi:hypothetical protein
MESRGITGKELSNSMEIYRIVRSGSRKKQPRISGETADALISALELLLGNNVKKQKAQKRHRVHREAD